MKSWSSRRRVAAILVVALLAAITLYQPSRTGLWLQSFYDWLHVPLFGLIATGLLFASPTGWHWSRKLLFASVATAVLGSATELVQLLVPARNASYSDLANDLLGVAAFMGLVAAFGGTIPAPRVLKAALLGVSAAMLAWSAAPLTNVTLAYWERHREAPSIAPLRSRKSRLFFLLENTTVHYDGRTEHGRVLPKFQFSRERSSSVNFHDPLPDWRGFDTLLIDIANAGPSEFCFVLRVHDRKHLEGDQPGSDRFRREFCIAEGRHELSIDLADIAGAPADREMDLGRIEGIVIYRRKPGPGRRFALHDMRLE